MTLEVSYIAGHYLHVQGHHTVRMPSILPFLAVMQNMIQYEPSKMTLPHYQVSVSLVQSCTS